MPDASKNDTIKLSTKDIVASVLSSIEREREREIIARRFGLYERKETLEQIGEMLGITRERVRQLEKTVLTKLQATDNNSNTKFSQFVDQVLEILAEKGDIARVSDLTRALTGDINREEQSRIAFLGLLSSKMILINDDDYFFPALGDTAKISEKEAKDNTALIVATIKKIAEPKDIREIAKEAKIEDIKRAEALASISRQLATLNGRWGLIKWPIVNPKNIRDKIYVILKENKNHMHFSEIAEAIKDSDFKRKDVTTQAIHNELIKDKRFVLIGRGIYALKEWGYERGTVSDIIAEVLAEAGEPLHRDEIVKRVLKSRFVKETTILLNLQGKPQFKRVAKATYALAE